MSLHVRRIGEAGRPVVLLHPLALSGAVWDPVAKFLSAGHQVLALDARGHGESPWDGKEFTVEDMAADAASVIEDFGSGPADVIGLSMGGSTALVLAATRPDLVHHLVLADATACYGPDRESEWAARAERAATVPRVEQLSFQRDRWFAEAFQQAHPEEVRRVSDIFVATDSRAHAAACRALGALDATAKLGDVEAETLVLVGDEDYATPPAMARELAGGIKGAKLRVLERTRHLSLLERPDLWPDVAEHLGWSGSDT
ncbi:alpha/beta fold hydrolase [Amycolatopsis alkalitolerans]|uniref:Alpha/beta fold hydrolase n=1 Tax=Amycolatopsis alkalitolerans TaxID=2547244 RepID=A0A5C4M747_9PSEU|nr:alpha/beta fold hydrolase [Amycolatopsis alkalitolerans]TNC27788.1 alpha/beta fold hydrolase [Amycolatopsis alkalitolerans]